MVKDRLYTDPAHSERRRSTQTALHRMIAALCKMLSPILAFTADEAWEFVPGKTVASVHQLAWQPLPFKAREEDRTLWRMLFELRELALPVLEKARQEKQIGKALEAKLTFSGDSPAQAQAREHLEELRELLNVSQLEMVAGPASQVEISVTRAAGEKCERCWHWETDVGADPEHPTICGRCVKAVKASPKAGAVAKG